MIRTRKVLLITGICLLVLGFQAVMCCGIAVGFPRALGWVSVTAAWVVSGLLSLKGWALGLPPLLILGLFFGWILFAYLHYRHTRQDEVLHVLTTAVETNMPLAPILRAYLQDRPSGGGREIWVGTLLFLVLPGYYWIWHRQRNYDRKVEAVADLLEEGVPLFHALQVIPGVVSRETLLAVAVGEVTGEMVLCLKRSARSRLSAAWIEILPRLFYPLLVLLFLVGVLTFLNIYILPKLQKILRELDVEVPSVTEQILSLWAALLLGLSLTFAIGLLLGLLLLVSSTVRWYFPVLGRVYRAHARGWVLRALGVLLEVKTPAPQALALLVDSGYFSRAVERGLDNSLGHVQQGFPLAESLYQGGLLSTAMVPLVQAAERAGNLPWALRELGENLSERAVRLVRRTGLIVSPLLLVAIGLLVGVVVVGMFVPLVSILERLGV